MPTPAATVPRHREAPSYRRGAVSNNSGEPGVVALVAASCLREHSCHVQGATGHRDAPDPVVGTADLGARRRDRRAVADVARHETGLVAAVPVRALVAATLLPRGVRDPLEVPADDEGGRVEQSQGLRGPRRVRLPYLPAVGSTVGRGEVRPPGSDVE